MGLYPKHLFDIFLGYRGSTELKIHDDHINQNSTLAVILRFPFHSRFYLDIFLILKIRLQREREREYWSMASPGPGWQQEPGASSGSPAWRAEVQARGPSLAGFARPLQGSWTRSDQPVRSQHPCEIAGAARKQIYPLCHNAIPDIFLLLITNIMALCEKNLDY